MDRRAILLFSLLILALVSPARVRAWKLVEESLREVSVPGGIQPVEDAMSADFDGDGKTEILTLADGRAAIQRENQVLWRSPEAWQVTQALVADLNQDGRQEAVLLVWRSFQPWPVDAWLPHGGRIDSFHDSNGKSCHIILIGWYQGSFRERWAGSALVEPVKSLAVADLAGKGEQHLVTLEARYDDPPSAPARSLKVWEWNGFGFSLVSTIAGPFSTLAIAQAPDGRMLILVS
jgi:hypothetical protein